MSMILIYKVNIPKLGEKPRLNVYGTLEIGEVPSFAFVIKLIPKELMTKPAKNIIYRFNFSVFVINWVAVFVA